MKQLFICLLLVISLATCLTLTASASAAPSGDPVVYVTIVDKGTVVMAERGVTVTDVDDDGTLTIHDTLYAAHVSYDGGVEAGYRAGVTDWGISLLRLWGDDSGNFGYYRNDLPAWNLTDAVKDGDRLVAFIYADTAYYSDTYAFFDTTRVTVEEGTADGVTLTLSLSYIGNDAGYSSFTLPLAGASITIDGEETAYTTDDGGRVTLPLSLKAGEHVISATHPERTLVAPVCVITVTGTPVNVGLIVGVCIGAALLASGAAVFTVVYRKTLASEKKR